MKKIIAFVCLLVFCFTSCVRSLHPIVGEEDRILDDRVVGIWSTNKPSVSNFEISFETDDPNENIDSLRTVLKDFMATTMNDQGRSWEISRAAKLEFEYDKEASSNKLEATVLISMEGVSENFDINEKATETGVIYTLKEKVLLDYYVMDFNNSKGSEKKKSKIVQLTKIGSNYFLDISELPGDNSDEDRSFDFLYPNIHGHTVVKLTFEEDHIKLYEFDSDYLESLINEKRIRLKHEAVEDGIVLTASTAQLRAFLKKYGNDNKLFADEKVFYTQNFG